MEFVVVDVETANSSPGSICQIGVACFRNGSLAGTWGELVNPESSFFSFNTALHGIDPLQVRSAPTWPQLQPRLRSLLGERVIASHTYFDRTALNAANLRYGLPSIPVSAWLDTCAMARRAWPHLPNHKLPTLARHFGIAYRAHDAEEDARVAGEVYLLTTQTPARAARSKG
ncbi:MAG: 3'-5' exonuclease [Acidobacteriaceae bacterium]